MSPKKKFQPLARRPFPQPTEAEYRELTETLRQIADMFSVLSPAELSHQINSLVSRCGPPGEDVFGALFRAHGWHRANDPRSAMTKLLGKAIAQMIRAANPKLAPSPPGEGFSAQWLRDAAAAIERMAVAYNPPSAEDERMLKGVKLRLSGATWPAIHAQIGDAGSNWNATRSELVRFAKKKLIDLPKQKGGRKPRKESN